MNCRTIIVEGALAFRMRWITAARRAEAGVQIMTLPQLVAHRLMDLSANLASVGVRDASFPLPDGRGDEFHRGGPGLDPRGLPKRTEAEKQCRSVSPRSRRDHARPATPGQVDESKYCRHDENQLRVYARGTRN